MAKARNNGGDLTFEKKLWQAADKMRNNMGFVVNTIIQKFLCNKIFDYKFALRLLRVYKNNILQSLIPDCD